VKALPPSTENELNPFGVGVLHNRLAFMEGESASSLLEMPSLCEPRYCGQLSAEAQSVIPDAKVVRVINFVGSVIIAAKA
jgi:hypothetical protein